MKVNEYWINALSANKILDELKASLEPEVQPHLTLTKFCTPCGTAYKIDYTAYVSKEDYKRIKAVARSNDGATVQERPIPEKLSLDKIFTEKALEILEEDAHKGDPENLIYQVDATPDSNNIKLSLTVSTDAYLKLASLATNLPDAENKEAPSDESNTENNKEDENEMAEILRKFCEFQTLKEIRIPPDDVPVEDGVKRIVIKLKD